MTLPPRNGFGRWYGEKQGDTGDVWHRTLIDPGLFRLLGRLPRGTRVLDIGCGNGYIARRLSRDGARVVGVDASRELIEYAREEERVHPLGIVYHLSDAARLPIREKGVFDVAVANMSLLDIKDAEGAIRELARVVRPGGRFVFSISHPCFDVDTDSAWSVERRAGKPLVFRKVARYRIPHSDQYVWNLAEGRTARTTGYHRPLSWYAQVLRRHAWSILDMDEPAPLQGYQSERVRKEWIDAIPLHLVVEARRDLVKATRLPLREARVRPGKKRVA